MITYEYSEYFPDDDKNFDKEKLMSILSDLIMKYDISLEEALRLMIEKGIPANLFLKEGGMEDLIADFQKKIQAMIDQILKTFNLNPASEQLEKDLKSLRSDLEKKFKKEENILQKLKAAIDGKNPDLLRRLKWDLAAQKKIEPRLDELIQKLQDIDKISNGIKQYNFTGKKVPTPKEAGNILDNLDELTQLNRALEEAIQSGDLYNFNLEQLAKFLGPESYNEFIERRERIFEALKKLLQESGDIQENAEGGIELSPKSIRKIGKTALIEIFSKLKTDSSSGSHVTNEFGDTENLTSSTKKLEFGDNVSNIDFPGSIINSILRGNGTIPSLGDLDVFQARGNAKSSTVILLDMSGSMARSMRFYNAKKVTMAMDSLIRNEYKDEKLTVVGFGSTAKIFPITKVPTLQPYPVTIFNPYIKLKFDFAKMKKEDIENRVPQYFTNLQKGLQIARQALSSKQTKNKQIFLITDGAPTAHFKGSILHINYPPAPSDFEEALSEVKQCTEDGIIINTFLLTSEWDMNYFGEKSFIQQFAKMSQGRIFYPHPNELNQMIIYDFVSNKKKKFSY
ncbi:MAG TPA: VWA domain-containing protein [Leptospiraceae bacterium]|nr:VWA domain-containing protein [Leptospiraceae bacterium]HMW07381.1 VWA domain-containing protein [Leptospiraceae bacterium]HMX34242.1 VWA domain-containing protein [Leptospiraceae bacterium]HMY32445.1 VWA domain-containing protein [Leptospiraceae bacterium]HMZ64200.1 VWA domain-containing protein [Leptospiraceae bacterium]